MVKYKYMKKTKIFLILLFILVVVIFGFKNPARAETYDLAAESLTVNPDSPEVNETAVFTARVKNLGADFTLNFPLNYSLAFGNYVSDGPAAVSPAQNTLIKTNDYITFTFSGHFTKLGSVALRFTVNPAGYLTESSANNTVSAAVSIQGYDLAADSLTVLPASPMVGQNCYVRVKIKNGSSYKLYTSTGLNITRSFQDFSITKASSTQPSLANNINSDEYFYYEYEGKFLSPGAKQFSFTVDPDDILHESDLTNNTLSPIINVYNAAETDLAVDSVTFSSEKIVLGVPFDLTIGVKNTGKTSLTDATGLIKQAFSYNLPNFEYGINDFVADNYPVLTAPFNPADIFHYKFHGAFTQPGSTIIAFSVNQEKHLLESSYANNATTTPVLVYISPAEADNFSLLSKTVSLASSTTAIISWTTNLKTTGALHYNLSHNNVSDNKIESPNSSLEHKITLNNLTPGANYIYSITTKNGTVEKLDMINNFSMPESNLLKITSGPSLSLSGQRAEFNWSTNLLSSGWAYYKKPDVSGLSYSGSDTLTADHKVELTGLAYGVYDYFLSSTSTPKTNFKTDWASFEIKEAPAGQTPPAAAVSPGQPAAAAPVSVTAAVNNQLYDRLKGKIILQVQDKGQAYYISPKEKKIYYLGRPDDAFAVIRSQGLGITNADLAKIPVGLSALSGADTDSDGLPDAFEDALATDKNKADTDGDGYNDKVELANGYSPNAKAVKINYDSDFGVGQKGKIFLQVESRGEAWYVNPGDNKRYFLSRPADAFNIMRQLGSGISNNDFAALSK